MAVSAKNLVVIRSLTGESEFVLRPDYGRIGWDCDQQNRARQFFPEFRFYGEIFAGVVGGCGICKLIYVLFFSNPFRSFNPFCISFSSVSIF